MAAPIAWSNKNEFVAMMSHEIRTPMNGVLGLIELLQGTPLDEDQTKLVSMVRDSADTMLALLDDILDFSKIEAGHLALTHEPTDLRGLFDRTIALMAIRARAKQLELHVHIDARLAARHACDPVRLRQILFNLLGNAIKFTDHGRIDVRVDVIATRVLTQEIAIRVEDTGIGLCCADLSSLFLPFVQGNHPTSRHRGGTGLGLSICRRLTDLMGGSISLARSPRGGTLARVELPLEIAQRRHAWRELEGCRAVVEVSDRALREALLAHLGALGLTEKPTAKDDVIVSEDREANSPTVKFSRRCRVSGVTYRASAPIRVGPLSWEHVLRACIDITDSQPPCTNTAAVAQPATRTGHTLRILIAEDHPTNRELARRQIQTLGYECDVVADGLAALDALSNRRYDLLLTDCHMPRMDGHALTLAVRASDQANHRNLPIVGITASTHPDEQARARRAGMNECLIKPAGIRSLMACISRVLATAPPTEARHGVQHAHGAPVEEPLPSREPLVMRVMADALREDLVRLASRDIEPSVVRAIVHRQTGAAAALGLAPLQHALARTRAEEEPSEASLASLRDAFEAAIGHITPLARQ